jgi:hypothetical protein
MYIPNYSNYDEEEKALQEFMKQREKLPNSLVRQAMVSIGDFLNCIGSRLIEGEEQKLRDIFIKDIGYTDIQLTFTVGKRENGIIYNEKTLCLI